MSFKKVMALIYIVMQFSLTSVAAKMGSESIGGGGDASEARVNDIREDMLNWIKKGGAKGLILSADISYDEYVSRMLDVLESKKVIISFTEDNLTSSDDRKICQGYIQEDTDEMHILCNISNFTKARKANQYKLIHHEYAILAKVEMNEGIVSDYNLSSQIIDFLSYGTVQRLAVKKVVMKNCSLFVTDEVAKLLISNGILKWLKKKKYILSNEEQSMYTINNYSLDAVVGTTGIYIGDPSNGPFLQVSSGITMINNVSGDQFDIVAVVSNEETRKPTVAKAVAALKKNIPKCE